MPGDCPASLHLLLLVCGKHSAPSRTPFRQATKTVRLPTGIGVHLQTGMLFGITTESCSASERNRVHLRPDSPPTENGVSAPERCYAASRSRRRCNSASENVNSVKRQSTQTITLGKIKTAALSRPCRPGKWMLISEPNSFRFSEVQDLHDIDASLLAASISSCDWSQR